MENSNRDFYTKTCPICSNTFSCSNKRQATCSRACMGIAQSQRARVKRQCRTCNSVFYIKKSEAKEGRGKYCSASCYRSRPLSPPADEQAILQLWETGLSARQIEQELNCPTHAVRRWLKQQGVYEPRRKGRNHGRWRGASCVRTVAEMVKGRAGGACENCGYNEYPGILQIHHKDRNRRNNQLSNLELLCPNCHEVTHLLTDTGRYGKNHASET